MLSELLAEIIKRVEASEDQCLLRKSVVACTCVFRKWMEVTTSIVRSLQESGMTPFLRFLSRSDICSPWRYHPNVVAEAEIPEQDFTKESSSRPRRQGRSPTNVRLLSDVVPPLIANFLPDSGLLPIVGLFTEHLSDVGFFSIVGFLLDSILLNFVVRQQSFQPLSPADYSPSDLCCPPTKVLLTSITHQLQSIRPPSPANYGPPDLHLPPTTFLPTFCRLPTTILLTSITRL
ncbi:Tubby-like F-box protein 7 [Dendrobium catenatum]|uniref:Tubby-like F-box protein 7 n=1 Tax=Dendrobium catenatum TaxID=906689 RepID=A0A2I0WEI9_9ASPA|nr:Tubby-like F-box protein 7 [Dendrobium catenatum]